ncbi:MAG: DUF4349 domain-containing protein [Eubacterium sp.]|nr:DUF4349 domain-containing protein [Eubacterium sp.]
MKKSLVLVLSGVLALSLSACGNSYKSSDSAMNTMTSDSYSKSDSAGFADSYNYDSEAAVEESYYEDVDMDDTSDSSSVTDKENSTNKIDMEKLIYRCSIALETETFNETVSSFQQIISKYNGFVENENTASKGSDYYGNSLSYYTATVRIPSENYKNFVNEAGSIGNLRSKSQNVTNVSQEYSDLSVEMEVLEAQRDDYMEMLKEAKNLEDMDNVILISDKIASVNTQINQIKTRLNSIDNDVAYSYVDISINEVKQVVQYTDDSFGTRFMKEVKQGWYDFGYGFQNFIIWIVAHIWGLLIFFGIIFLIIFIIKKIIKKSMKKAEERRLKRMGMVPPQPPVNAGKPAAPQAPAQAPAAPAQTVAPQAPAQTAAPAAPQAPAQTAAPAAPQAPAQPTAPAQAKQDKKADSKKK